MAIVALHQMYRVQIEGLCSWRGGGFGMYASFHPRHHELWVTNADTNQTVRYAKYDDNVSQQYRAVRPLLTWPTKTQAAQALARLPEEHEATTVSVYRLDFDPVDCVLKRKLMAKAPDGSD